MPQPCCSKTGVVRNLLWRPSVRATIEGSARPLRATVLGRSRAGRVTEEVTVSDAGDGRAIATVGPLAPGFYELQVVATYPSEQTVVTPFVVLEPDA